MTHQTPIDVKWEASLVIATVNFGDSEEAITALEHVSPAWFIDNFYRQMWKLISSSYLLTGKLDFVDLHTKIQGLGWSEDHRGKALQILTESYNAPFAHTDIRFAMEKCREAYMRRESMKRLQKIYHRLDDISEPIDTALIDANEALTFLMSDAAGNEMRESTFEAEAERYLAGKGLYDDGDRRQMVRFGIPEIDNELIACPGSVGVIAAKTSAGKTSLAIQALIETARAGFKPAFFSLEDSDEEVAGRLIANVTNTYSGKVIRGTGVEQPGRGKLLAIAKSIIKVCRVPGKRFEALAAKIRELVLRCGVQVVFVDYFTLLNPPDLKNRNGSVAYQLGEMSKGFKQIATDLQIPIVLLSQFNRLVADGERPLLEHLRETGQLEQDAHWVMMMWTDKKDYKPDEVRIVNLELQKNKGGKRWVKAKASFVPATGRFGQESSGEGLRSIEEEASDGFPVEDEAPSGSA